MRFEMFRQLVKNCFAVCSTVPDDSFFLVIITSALGAGHEPAEKLILVFVVDRQGWVKRALPFRHPTKLLWQILLCFLLVVILHTVSLLQHLRNWHNELLFFCIRVLVEVDGALHPIGHRLIELLVEVKQRRRERKVVMARVLAARGVLMGDAQVVT